MEKITLEQVPSMIVEICQRLERIETLLLETQKRPEDEQVFLTIAEASELVNLKQSTIYGKIYRREIPVIKKGGKLYFEKRELVEWIQKGRVKTQVELSEAASRFLNRR